MVALGTGQGGGLGGRKGLPREVRDSGGDGRVHYFNCSDGFTVGTYFQTYQAVYFNVCHALYVSYNSKTPF